MFLARQALRAQKQVCRLHAPQFVPRVVSRFTTDPTATTDATPPPANADTLTPEQETEFSIWDAPDLKHIFDNNRKWVKKQKALDPDFFTKLATGQQPEYLVIGCSDSRVPAQEIMGLKLGELFVHRNVANLVVNTDLNMLAVLQYAVQVLKVKDIFVMGHYGCGGVKASTENKDLGLIEHWLRNIRDVQRLHASELDGMMDNDEKFRRLVELNVQEQCLNLFKNNIVQHQQALTGRPRIHGFVYDIAVGELLHLKINFKSIVKKYRDIYRVMPAEDLK